MTTTAPPTARPLRVCRAPALDPPYDDEVGTAEQPMVDGSLALAFPGADALPLRLVPPAVPGCDPGADPRARPTALPDPRPWTGRLIQAVVEVLAGARPAAQLSPFASLEVLGHLECATGRLAHRRTGTPARRPVVSSVRVGLPAYGVAEACAVIDTGARRRAIALRLEGVDGRWRCTALQVG